MRYSREHKARKPGEDSFHGGSLVSEHGGDTSGIGTVMKKAGLTKGGFYRHFASKDDLFVEAVARAFDEMGTGMLEAAKSAPEGQALRAIIERYLSTATRIHREWVVCSPRSGQSSHESRCRYEKRIEAGAAKRTVSGCCRLCLAGRERKK